VDRIDASSVGGDGDALRYTGVDEPELLREEVLRSEIDTSSAPSVVPTADLMVGGGVLNFGVPNC
jgi:hypothetical protein